ncbi:MAG: hypothetical protein ABJ056_00370 [Halioglobus sp.]
MLKMEKLGSQRIFFSSKLAVVLANGFQIAAVASIVVFVSRFFGPSEAATLARTQVLATLVTYIALGGFHLRISEQREWGGIVAASHTAFSVALRITFFSIIPLLAYQHVADQSISVLAAIFWSLGMQLQVTVSYALIANGRNFDASLLRVVNATIFIVIMPIWWLGIMNFSEGVYTIAFTMACSNAFFFLALVSRPNEKWTKRSYLLKRLSNHDFRYAVKNLLFVSTNNLNASLIFLIPGFMGSPDTLVLLFLASRALAAILQAVGNPMSQWFVRTLESGRKGEYRYAQRVFARYSGYLFAVSILFIVAYFFVHTYGAQLLALNRGYYEELPLLLLVSGVVQIVVSPLAVSIILAGKAHILALVELGRFSALMAVGFLMPSAGERLEVWFFAHTIFYLFTYAYTFFVLASTKKNGEKF